jgi:hypothetical protein
MKKNNSVSLNALKTQSDAVIHFIKNLDIDMIDTLLDDKFTYQDLKKNVFIKKLEIAFDEFIIAGDTELMVNNGFCSQFVCNNQCSGFRFSSSESGLYFDLIIDIENGVVIDIYECSSFMCLSADLNAKKRVLIDRTEYNFNFDYPSKNF